MASIFDIKILTMESQTYTIRVDRNVPVPTLKEQIAQVTGVVSDHQRLLCRGKVLTDDNNLSAYHVEDGHTIHLVRQPLNPSPVSTVYTDLRSLINDRISTGSSSEQPEDMSSEFSDMPESGDLIRSLLVHCVVTGHRVSERIRRHVEEVNVLSEHFRALTDVSIWLTTMSGMQADDVTIDNPQAGISEMRNPRRRRREDDEAFGQQPEARRRRRFSSL